MDPLDPEHDFGVAKSRRRPVKDKETEPNGKSSSSSAAPGKASEPVEEQQFSSYDYAVRDEPSPAAAQPEPFVLPQSLPPPGGPGFIQQRPGPPPPPGLPPPHLFWSQHVDPAGKVYYHNAATKESRWDRPPEFRPPPPPPRPMGGPPPNGMFSASVPAQSQPTLNGAPPPTPSAVPNPDVERPLALKKIPLTKWAIVLTNKDHEFFYNTDTKTSAWEMPDELGDLIGALIADAMGVEDYGDEEEWPTADQFDDGQSQASELPADERPNGRDSQATGNAEEGGLKRKTEDEGETRDESSKRVKKEPEEPQIPLEPKREALGGPADAPAVDVKVEEFLALLREKNVSPYTTWEMELPKIVEDRRYNLVPTLKERKQVFDNYCIARVAELREEQKNKGKDTKEAYFKLLQSETNIRTRWEDFSRKFKRDRRFTEFDAKQREKVFKEHIAALKNGGRPRGSPADAFIALLKGMKDLHPRSSWSSVKRDIEHKAEYRALRSSTEREDLFRDYIRKLDKDDMGSDRHRSNSEEQERNERDRAAREAASLRDREAQVRRSQSLLNREMSSHRSTLLRQDASTLLRSLLIDTVRSPDADWTATRAFIQRRDPSAWDRVRALHEDQMRTLFEDHVAELHQKRLQGFHAALEHTTDLTTKWDDISTWVLRDPRTRRLAPPDPSDDPTVMTPSERDAAEVYAETARREFERYQALREQNARADLQKALLENSFVNFHVKAAVVDARASAIEKGEKDSKEGDEWGFIDLDEVVTVLNDDKRFVDMRHFEADRDRAVKEHLRDLIRKYRAERGGTVDRTLVGVTR
ncbi:uncharacterized protein EV422DRAFT_352058 [Fimicolochytrium jonesii]|uniref:uncharacterized protein n=1 Tax=Fimicolochytrium jonesii TaxID=1396493 RepID=UPI0022FDD17D|nr:uncharacterized protein EV422DRAFT_352058 [Fimicolochytrium jonesii]KAI8823363.1 hypothetical protein EV422DRAFT_352058 [Fimicolochytrium jonesii]